MHRIGQRKVYMTACSQIMLSLLTAPLFTVSTSMQISIPKNVVTIQQFKRVEENSRKFQVRMGHLTNASNGLDTSIRFGFWKQLMSKNRTEVAAQQQKVQSMSLPWKMPVYRSYWETIQGLYKQSIRGFYKGNMIRSAHILLFHKLNADLNTHAEQTWPDTFKQVKQVPCLKEFLLATTVDMLLQPLFLAETRFIAQNRHPNFSIYSSVLDLVRKSPTELYRGVTMNIPRNFFIALTGLKMSDELSLTQYYGSTLAFQTLAYPFLTLQKRLECRSRLTGLVSNSSSVFSLVREEGVLSLYKGYLCHSLALLVWMSLLPKVSDWLMDQLPLYMDPKKITEIQ